MAIDPVAVVATGNFSKTWASTDIPDSVVTYGLLLDVPGAAVVTSKAMLSYLHFLQLRKRG